MNRSNFGIMTDAGKRFGVPPEVATAIDRGVIDVKARGMNPQVQVNFGQHKNFEKGR